MRSVTTVLLFTLSVFPSPHVQRVWLTHQSRTPDRIVINWESAIPTVSVVRYGLTPVHGRRVVDNRETTLHHVEIAIPDRDVTWHYSIGEGEQATPDASFKAYPTTELRVAIVGNWGFAKDKDVGAVMRDNVHLLMTAGDNVPSLHQAGMEGVKAFSALIDQQPTLFRSIPFLPVLGNHDKEVRPREAKPPPTPVYDVEAKAYRQFFALPGDEWKWAFDIADFAVQFIALDLNHIMDFGTTWQSCPAWDEGSEQFRWFKQTVAESTADFIFVINNENPRTILKNTAGFWGEQFRKTSGIVTANNYWAERFELDGGLPSFNTSLRGERGSQAKNAPNPFLASQDNYLLLTFRKGSDMMTAQLKNLDGAVLNTRQIKKRIR